MTTPNGPNSVSKNILCVEDDLDTCEVLSILLREYNLECFNSLSSAMPAMETRGADLYILDNWLPDGSGIDFCRKIRTMYPSTPIIFTSAAAQNTDINEAIEAGANRYLLKPCEPETLQEVVKELLN
jgi:DNA-binding response OmpR family regulator